MSRGRKRIHPTVPSKYDETIANGWLKTAAEFVNAVEEWEASEDESGITKALDNCKRLASGLNNRVYWFVRDPNGVHQKRAAIRSQIVAAVNAYFQTKDGRDATDAELDDAVDKILPILLETEEQ